MLSDYHRRLWCLPPYLCAFAADVALTLHGQSAEYWAGNYGDALEANPLAYPLLAYSPWLFVGAAVVWGLFLSSVFVGWPHRASGWIAVLATYGHAVGAGSWLVRFGAWGWVAAVAHLAVVVGFVRWCRR